MKVWIFYPPLKSMSGGCLVLLQIARQMLTAGALGSLLCWETPPEHPGCAGLPWVRAADAPMRAGDILIVPEGWPNALALGFRAQCRSFIYCQNWSYLFHGLDERTHWHDLPVEFLAVSDPVAWYMEQALRRRPAIIRPAIDAGVFFPPAERSGNLPRIAFMPRKNKALAEQIRRIFEERNPGSVEWVSIHGLDQAGVAEVLRSCHIFLVTGFPEGCPLPPLEALACDCLCVGFAGFGGWDYMRQVEEGGFAPYGYQLRSVPWDGNGWWFADGDTLGAALGLERALSALDKEQTFIQAAQTVAAYDHGAQQREVLEFLNML